MRTSCFALALAIGCADDDQERTIRAQEACGETVQAICLAADVCGLFVADGISADEACNQVSNALCQGMAACDLLGGASINECIAVARDACDLTGQCPELTICLADLDARTCAEVDAGDVPASCDVYCSTYASETACIVGLESSVCSTVAPGDCPEEDVNQCLDDYAAQSCEAVRAASVPASCNFVCD